MNVALCTCRTFGLRGECEHTIFVDALRSTKAPLTNIPLVLPRGRPRGRSSGRSAQPTHEGTGSDQQHQTLTQMRRRASATTEDAGGVRSQGDQVEGEAPVNTSPAVGTAPRPSRGRPKKATSQASLPTTGRKCPRKRRTAAAVGDSVGTAHCDKRGRSESVVPPSGSGADAEGRPADVRDGA